MLLRSLDGVTLRAWKGYRGDASATVAMRRLLLMDHYTGPVSSVGPSSPSVRRRRPVIPPRAGVRPRAYLPGVPEYRFTPYFEREVLRKRPYLRKEWCIQAVESPIRSEEQENNRCRFWIAVPELGGRYLRVVTLADRVLFITHSPIAGSSHEAELLRRHRLPLHRSL